MVASTIFAYLAFYYSGQTWLPVPVMGVIIALNTTAKTFGASLLGLRALVPALALVVTLITPLQCALTQLDTLGNQIAIPLLLLALGPIIFGGSWLPPPAYRIAMAICFVSLAAPHISDAELSDAERYSYAPRLFLTVMLGLGIAAATSALPILTLPRSHARSARRVRLSRSCGGRGI